MLKDLDKLLVVTKDEKFVTARHSLQCLWKIGITSAELREKLVKALSLRFKDCSEEKNGTLTRFDIMEVFRKIFDKVPDENLLNTSVMLINTEPEAKYKKKYLGVWKDVMKTKR